MGGGGGGGGGQKKIHLLIFKFRILKFNEFANDLFQVKRIYHFTAIKLINTDVISMYYCTIIQKEQSS